VPRKLIPSHKSPVVPGPTAQTTDDNLVVRAPVFPSSAILVFGVATPWVEVLAAERGFTQTLQALMLPSACWAVVLRSLALLGY
jgi:hypothetical protein